jgi:hypothetical protein
VGAGQVYRLQTDQRSVRNRDRETFVQASDPVPSVLGAWVGILRVETGGGIETAMVHPTQGGIAYDLAGLWETWKSPEGEVVESCTILITASNRLVEPLHDRMRIILSHDEYLTWLERTTTDPTSLKKMFQPYPADLMEMWPVSQKVNKVANDSADLVRPVEDTSSLDLDTNPCLLL